MDDIRDPETAERLAFEDSDEYLRRREFLQRTALTAGLATGMGTLLSADTLVAEAATRQKRVKVPDAKNMPIDTFVVLMMENRSFDHYLGWLPGADGRQAGMTYKDPAGSPHATHRLTPDFQGCAFNDPDHSWTGGRTQLDGGKLDGFRRGTNDDFAIGYYTEPDLPFIGHAAKAFTTYDRFFCSILASTFPNREYMHSGESYGKVDNGLPPAPGFPDNTIFAALKNKGVSNSYFYNDIPVAALWGAPGLARSARVEDYYTRCKAGTLPHLSFVDPSFLNEDGGTSGDEHPHGDIRVGQAYMSDVVHAFMESPQFKTGALFIVYDEWGGFFEHVRPPRVPDMRNDRDINKDYGQMGFRIPAIAVSPYVRRGNVQHGIYGFESILKMICNRFGVAPLNKRVRYAHNIAESFDWESKPQVTPPDLPDPPTVAGSTQCSGRGVSVLSVPRGGKEAPAAAAATPAERPAPHDLETLETSGYLDRLGFHYKPATASSTFREPHKVEAAHKAAGGGG
jgi:phospholipase C